MVFEQDVCEVVERPGRVPNRPVAIGGVLLRDRDRDHRFEDADEEGPLYLLVEQLERILGDPYKRTICSGKKAASAATTMTEGLSISSTMSRRRRMIERRSIVVLYMIGIGCCWCGLERN